MTQESIDKLKQEDIKWWINHFISNNKEFIIWETPSGVIVPVAQENNNSVPFEFKRICDSTNCRDLL